MFFDAHQLLSLACPRVACLTPLINRLATRQDLTLAVLEAGDLEGALAAEDYAAILVPPTVLLRHGATRLLPGMGLAAENATGSERLCCTQALDTLETVAVHHSAHHLLPLLQLILLERGFSIPTTVPWTMEGDQPTLYSGDAGFAQGEAPSFDLGTLWRETTGLPLVLGVWACRNNAPYRALWSAIGEASRDVATITPAGCMEGSTLHYRILSQESDSVRTLHALAVKHQFVEATAEAISFC